MVTLTASNRNRVLVCTGSRGLRDVSLQHHSNYDFQDIQLSGCNRAIRSTWIDGKKIAESTPMEPELRGEQNGVLTLSAVHSRGTCAQMHTHVPTQNP